MWRASASRIIVACVPSDAGPPSLSGQELDVAAVGLHLPRVAPVGEADLEDLPEPRTETALEDRDDGLDALGEVAAHPVGRADEELPSSGSSDPAAKW